MPKLRGLRCVWGILLRPAWLEQNEHGKHKMRLEGKHQGPSDHTGHCARKNSSFDSEGHGRSCHETGTIWLAFELDLFGCCAESNLKDNDKSRDLVRRLDTIIQVAGGCARSHIHTSGRVSLQTWAVWLSTLWCLWQIAKRSPSLDVLDFFSTRRQGRKVLAYSLIYITKIMQTLSYNMIGFGQSRFLKLCLFLGITYKVLDTWNCCSHRIILFTFNWIFKFFFQLQFTRNVILY